MSAERLWGGGFEQPLDPVIDRFCESFSFDRRLLLADVASNRAWIAALRDAGALTGEEAARLDAALADIATAEITFGGAVASDAGCAAAAAGRPPEDVHTFVECEVEHRVGAELAGKLRTGRSRNDLVATDLRLYCREEAVGLRRDLAACVGRLADLAGRAGALIVPGYTHLRRAQPILLAHQFLAHATRLMRDDARVAEALGRMDVCPLGSGALAGTTVPVDRLRLARRLGFATASTNSLDAVSDRDFVADLLYASALVMIHLSQIAEDLILATATEFGWLALPDAAVTGSSLMPQKKNPDALELLRGKAGRVVGRLAGFLTTLKGLPTAYNRDLQEDKEALFDGLDTARGALQVLAVVLRHLQPLPERGLADGAGDMLATDLADYLVGRGLPFADAHTCAGRAAALARETGTPLARLSLEALRDISPLVGADVFERLDALASVARRACAGGTAPERVAEELARVRAWVEAAAGAGREHP
jgi:argininosuccinate lyase